MHSHDELHAKFDQMHVFHCALKNSPEFLSTALLYKFMIRRLTLEKLLTSADGLQ